MDAIESVFVFCFVFGLATTLLSFALGSLKGLDAGDGDPGHGHPGHGEAGHGEAGHVDAGHVDAPHLDLGDGGLAPAHAGAEAVAGKGLGDGDAAGKGGPSPLNLQTATAFLTFFGGVGYLLHGSAGLGPALALIGATLGGLAGGGVVFLFLARVLVAGQRFVSPESSRLEGTVARVSIPIRPGGTGEIVFDRDGARRSEGARAEQGLEIPAGTEVVVVRYARGIAYVVPWTTYTGEA